MTLEERIKSMQEQAAQRHLPQVIKDSLLSQIAVLQQQLPQQHEDVEEDKPRKQKAKPRYMATLPSEE
jgi:hypothetical protein